MTTTSARRSPPAWRAGALWLAGLPAVPRLIGFRRRHPWLYTARTQVVTLTNCQLVYHATHEAHRLSVALNVAGCEVNFDVNNRTTGRCGGAGADPNGRHLIVPPHGWAIVG